MFFFQAEDGIRDLVRSRGLGDVYKRQAAGFVLFCFGLLVFRLVVLQVVRHDDLATQAENNLSLIHI